ncbi:hypothetical protein TRIP_B200371 [uncultured Desulfatiglans sp.]|nr:hypothetical protein TRIP_B200371 [uncultured Desulfatiglans sp.]
MADVVSKWPDQAAEEYPSAVFRLSRVTAAQLNVHFLQENFANLVSAQFATRGCLLK